MAVPEHARTVDTEHARRATLALLARRAAGKTICPSEVARALAPDDWRAAMPVVHAAIDGLVAERAVTLSWKGTPRARRGGPYRIALTPPATDPIH